MKTLVAYLFLSLLSAQLLTAKVNPTRCESSDFAMIACEFGEPATVEQVLTALAEYTDYPYVYLQENLIACISNGYNEYNEEVGTVEIETTDGPVTWNWKYGGNIMVIWPT